MGRADTISFRLAISALLRDFRQGGPAAIAKVRKYQPAAYMKICALMIPKEMKVEHSDGIKAMTDEQLDEALDALRELCGEACRRGGERN